MQDIALVQVEVTEANNDKTYGAAYLTGRNCAITALHVVRNYKAIQFNFSNGSVINRADQFEVVYPVDLTRQDIVADVAIIRFLVEDDFLLPDAGHVLTGAKPSVEDGWHGVGYPKFAGNGKAREKEELKGSCYRLPDGGGVIDLACDKWAKLAEWGGVSGAPVFLNKNNYLVAIITQHDRALENTHFKAVPLSSLFCDQSFTRWFIDPTKSDVLVEATVSLLAENPDLLAVFPEETPETVVESFRSGDIEQFFEQIEALPEKLATKEVCEFTLQCLPHFFVDQSVIIDNSLLVDDIIDLECVKEVSAECAMAAFSGRAARLSCDESAESGLHIDRGSYALAPETGIDNPELELTTLTNQLLSLSALEDIAASDTALDRNVQERLAKFATGRSNVTDYVNRKLVREKARGKYYYYIVSLDDTAGSRLARDKIGLYKRTYPALVFVNLKKRDDLPFREGALYEFLPELITG